MFPSQYSPFTGRALTHRSRSRKGQSPKSAVIRGLLIESRDIFCSAPPLGCGIHSHHSLRSIFIVNVCLKSRPVRGSPRRARSFGYCFSSRARSAVSRDIFCSAPPLGCGSVHVLGGSFARFCVSENVRVPLRYSGQPLHRKIIASRSPNTPWFCLSNQFFAYFDQV